MEVTVKEFDEMRYFSVGTGKRRVWNINDVIEKLKERSIINAEQSAEISFSAPTVGDFGDVDISVYVHAKLESLWTPSPILYVTLTAPLHITCNGDIQSGFEFGIDYEPESPMDFTGTFYLVKEDEEEEEDCEIDFRFSDLSEKQRNKVVNFVIELIEQHRNMLFKRELELEEE